MKPNVIDKVSWHYPEGKGCPSIEAAKKHIKAMTLWLSNHGMLNSYGIEVIEAGIDEDFSITQDMLTESGKKLLLSNYSNWIKTIRYGIEPDMKYWDDKLCQISG